MNWLDSTSKNMSDGYYVLIMSKNLGEEGDFFYWKDKRIV